MHYIWRSIHNRGNLVYDIFYISITPYYGIATRMEVKTFFENSPKSICQPPLAWTPNCGGSNYCPATLQMSVTRQLFSHYLTESIKFVGVKVFIIPTRSGARSPHMLG